MLITNEFFFLLLRVKYYQPVQFKKRLGTRDHLRAIKQCRPVIHLGNRALCKKVNITSISQHFTLLPAIVVTNFDVWRTTCDELSNLLYCKTYCLQRFFPS